MWHLPVHLTEPFSEGARLEHLHVLSQEPVRFRIGVTGVIEGVEPCFMALTELLFWQETIGDLIPPEDGQLCVTVFSCCPSTV